MENFLKTLEHATCLKSPESDNVEEISILAFIAQLEGSTLTLNEVQNASNIAHNIIQILYGPELVDILKNLIMFLNENDNRSCISFHSRGVKIHVSDRWFFQVILLKSLKNNRELLSNKKNYSDCEVYMQHVLMYILKYVDNNKLQSVYLLQILLSVLKSFKTVLTSGLKLEILKLTSKLFVSQINNFKYYSRNISKIILSTLTHDEINRYFGINILPIRGLETCDLLELTDIKVADSEYIVAKLLKMFTNNIENRDAGFLYEHLVKSSSFNVWRKNIWPHFIQSLQMVDHESEFFQSFLKYWIPQNVGVYKADFYNFIRETSTDNHIKAYILLEIRRRGYHDKVLFNDDLKEFFYNKETSPLALKICTTYHKITCYPNIFELGLIKKYVLYSISAEYLEEEEIKAIEYCFSQIFACAHHICSRNDVSSYFLLTLYKQFIKDIFVYCFKLLKTSYSEVPAQLINIIWSIADGESKHLRLHYKLEQKLSYKAKMNCFYGVLESEGIFKMLTANGILVDDIKQCFIKSKGGCKNLTKIILCRYVEVVDIFENNLTLIQVVEKFLQTPLLKTADGIKNYAEIYFVTASYEEGCKFQNHVVELLQKNLKDCHRMCSISLIFKNVLLLELILVSIKYKMTSDELYRVVQDCMDLIEFVLEEDVVKTICKQETLKVLNGNEVYIVSRVQKVVESCINNVLYCLLQIENVWHNVNKNHIIQQLRKIIRISNMKKPVTLSSEVLKHFGSTMETNSHDRCLKIRFINEILNSICEASEVQNLKIRRSPECRLILHAMCISEKDPQKNFLTWVLNDLLNILNNPDSSNSALSSALHCLQILTSDTSFHTHTIPFIPRIILECVRLFESPSWTVRNADLQLTKAIIDRFYGVIISDSNRPKNIEDIFGLFPQLAVPFYKILTRLPLTNSAVIVLQFFSVSQVRKQPFKCDFIDVVRDCFLRIFTKLISSDSSHIGMHTVDAYVALCLEENIPAILCDTVDFIEQHLGQLKMRNVFRNFVVLLNKLYQKYAASLKFSSSEACNKRVTESLKHFCKILQTLNPSHVDFLSLKSKPPDLVLEELSLVVNSDFKSRLFQNNCVATVISSSSPENLELSLEKILSVQVLECVQIKILSILVQRFSKGEFNTDISKRVLNILVHRMITLEENRDYLLNCYFKVIMLFFENMNDKETFQLDPEVLDTFRNTYSYIKNVYKVMVYFAIISNIENKIDIDKEFVKHFKDFYNSLDLNNEENVENVSSVIKYLYKCGSCAYDKYKVLKIAVYMLLKFGIFDFVGYISKSKILSVLDALCKILNYELLKDCIKDQGLIKKFVADTYSLVTLLNASVEEENLTFYSREVDVIVPDYFLGQILDKFVRDFNKD